MASTRTLVAGREQCFQQVERLTNSHSLKGSESLCKLLRYLAEHSLDQPGAALKEYQIATEVLGRSVGFDPQSDSTVRVQAGRLRIKLADYYSHEGPDDPILVELPKGSYALSFHARTPNSQTPTNGPTAYHGPVQVEAPERRAEIPGPARSWRIAAVVLGILLLVSLVAVAVLGTRGRGQVAVKEAVPVAYQVFWNRFVTGPQQPWVIFSNGRFTGSPQTGMRYFNSVSDPTTFVTDYYTGVGEVLAVHELDSVFGLLHRPIRVKRGALFSLDDAKNNDLIFVGSPMENLSLLDVPTTREFVFERQQSGPRKGEVAVRNVHPQAGEPGLGIATAPGRPMKEDYAVIALLPGLDPARSLLILAGDSTFGTQAAVEYVCRENSLKELLQRLNASKPSELRWFEAMLRVKVAQGVPVATELVAVRLESY